MNNQQPVNHKFFKALKYYELMLKLHGEEHPITMQAFMLAFEYSPQYLKDEAFKMAEQHLPKPSGCLDNGQLVYNPKDLADHYDISFKQAETSLLNMMQQRKEHGLCPQSLL